MNIETVGIVVFLLILIILLYLNRKKIVNQKVLFPVIYILMLRTRLGLNLMDKLARKYGKLLKYIGYFSIVIGFIGMIIVSYSLIAGIYKLFTVPGAPSPAGIIAPVKAKGFFYVPFFYLLISIFVIAVIHEFSHGVFIRLYNIKIKSSGFAVLSIFAPIVPAAFVEPNEKVLVKKPAKEQLSIYSAGPFSNILLAFIIALLLGYILHPVLFESKGVEVVGFVDENTSRLPAEKAGMKKGEIIKEIDDKKVQDKKGFIKLLNEKKPGDILEIKTNSSTYNVVLTENPEKKGRPYLGILADETSSIKEDVKKGLGFSFPVVMWFYGLLLWMYVLNLGIGLFNLVPVGPIDGGRMLRAVLERFFKKEISDRVFKGISMFFLMLILVIIITSFF